MFARAPSIATVATLLVLASASRVTADIAVPSQPHASLNLELQSLRDNITLYKGDPQHLLLMKVRPDRFRPRVTYTGQSDAVLQIRDLYLFENPQASSQTAAERDEAKDGPLAETWEIELCPSGPTKFSLQCERGEGVFDFTDLEVQSVHIQADGTRLDVDFSDQNPIVLEDFTAHVPTGSFRFQHMINARAKEITLYVPGSTCQFEVTGKEFEGESAINLQGEPAEMVLVVSRKVGVRVTGPAATTAHFEAPHMTHAGEDWVSQGYDVAKCRVRITFAAEVPKLHVTWK